ncbi:MAG: hypothetical protein WBB65_11095 [Anaerolineales bacterium]
MIDPPQPNTRLGDWYGNVLFSGYHRLIIFVSERSLLPVIMPLRERKQLLPSFRSRLSELLFNLDVSEKAVSLELANMEQALIARTSNRSVLGTMNQFIQDSKIYMQMHDEFNLIDLELWLAETPCGPKKYRYPDKLAPLLLSE